MPKRGGGNHVHSHTHRNREKGAAGVWWPLTSRAHHRPVKVAGGRSLNKSTRAKKFDLISRWDALERRLCGSKRRWKKEKEHTINIEKRRHLWFEEKSQGSLLVLVLFSNLSFIDFDFSSGLFFKTSTYATYTQLKNITSFSSDK